MANTTQKRLIIGYYKGKLAKSSRSARFITVPIKVHIDEPSKPEPIIWTEPPIPRNLPLFTESKPKLGLPSEPQPKLKFDFHCQTSNIEVYTCRKCNFGTDFAALLTKHFKETHLGGTPTEQTIRGYVCRCAFETYSTLHWLKHLYTCPCRKRTDVQWFHCMKCLFVTRSLKDLEVHEMYIHSLHRNDKVNQNEMEHSYAHKCYNCRKCDFVSYFYSQLLMHKRTAHKTEKWFECDKCDYKTKKKLQLTGHRELYHAEDWFISRQENKFKYTKYPKNSEIVEVISCAKYIDHEHAYALKQLNVYK